MLSKGRDGVNKEGRKRRGGTGRERRSKTKAKGRAFGSPLARGLYPRANTAGKDTRANPGHRPARGCGPKRPPRPPRRRVPTGGPIGTYFWTANGETGVFSVVVMIPARIAPLPAITQAIPHGVRKNGTTPRLQVT